jgi:hypothetical protein
MGGWIEDFRLVGTVVALVMIGAVVAVSLIFEAPRTWPKPRANPSRDHPSAPV